MSVFQMRKLKLKKMAELLGLESRSSDLQPRVASEDQGASGLITKATRLCTFSSALSLPAGDLCLTI